MIKDELIIINAFPKDEIKIKMLERQLSYLKQLNLPILIISGCTVPEHIINQVDYVIINTENELLDRDWTHKIVTSGFKTYVFDSLKDNNFHANFYWPNVNSTITKNIQLAFKTACFLGYKTVFYTEDDNIWKEGSFNYIKENLNALNTEQYKLAGVVGKQSDMYPIFFTTFFFANIDFLINNLILPHTKKEWYDINIISKFNLNKTYEGCWYDLFENKIHLIYNSNSSFNLLSNPEDMEWGIYDRRHSEKNLLKIFFTVLPSNDNKKILILNNTSYYLKEGSKSYHVDIFYDDIFYKQVHLTPGAWHYDCISDDIKNIKFIFNDGNTITENVIDCSWNVIVNNGKIDFY